MDASPDPLEHEDFNTEVTSILRSDAIIFEPEINSDIFVSPLRQLKRRIEVLELQIPCLSVPNISDGSQFNESLKNIKLEGVENPSRYPNHALIVHENNPVQKIILEMLQEVKKSKFADIFKWRALSCEQVSQFKNDSEYVDPLIRAGQVISLPSFTQPDPFFWDMYSAAGLQIFGGVFSDFSKLNSQILGAQG